MSTFLISPKCTSTIVILLIVCLFFQTDAHSNHTIDAVRSILHRGNSTGDTHDIANNYFECTYSNNVFCIDIQRDNKMEHFPLSLMETSLIKNDISFLNDSCNLFEFIIQSFGTQSESTTVKDIAEFLISKTLFSDFYCHKLLNNSTDDGSFLRNFNRWGFQTHNFMIQATISKFQKETTYKEKCIYLQNKAKYALHLSKYFPIVSVSFDEKVFGDGDASEVSLNMFKYDPRLADRQTLADKILSKSLSIFPSLYHTIASLLLSFDKKSNNITDFLREAIHFYSKLPENIGILDFYMDPDKKVKEEIDEYLDFSKGNVHYEELLVVGTRIFNLKMHSISDILAETYSCEQNYYGVRDKPIVFPFLQRCEK